MSEGRIEKYRMYKDAFEMAVQESEDEDSIQGWSDIVRLDTDLLESVKKMVQNRDNQEGRKIAVLHCKHRKKSIRFLSDKIMRGDTFDVEDRTHISLSE
ncbi:MAG: hypothetical protein ACOC80_10325 [Petrotogales bacterium]